jgi:hypothetical protein
MNLRQVFRLLATAGIASRMLCLCPPVFPLGLWITRICSEDRAAGLWFAKLGDYAIFRVS